MFVEAKIITDSKEKMALQLRALLEENCNYFVLNLNSTTGDAYNFKIVALKTN